VSVPASKLDQFTAKLDDLETPLLPFRALQIERDLRSLLRQVDSAKAVEIFLLLGVLFQRTDRNQESLQENERAARLAPRDPRPALGRAGALLRLGQTQEAIDVLRPLAAIEGPHRLQAQINLTVGFMALGLPDESRRALTEAEKLASSAARHEVLRLAMTAAAAGFEHETLVYFAWFLRISRGQPRQDDQAVQIVQQASRERETLRAAAPWLVQVIETALASAASSGRPPDEPPSPRSDASAEPDFEAMEREVRETLAAQGFDADSVLQRATEKVQQASGKLAPLAEHEIQRATEWVLGRP
jgi:tetratricopeptide (TPR) repeat protein